MNYQYEDTDELSVFGFGDYLRKICLYMHESDSKWKFMCAVDSIQNTIHVSSTTHSELLKNIAKQIQEHLEARPYDEHFVDI